MNVKNIFSGIPKSIQDEIFEDVLKTKYFKVERIVSVKSSLSEAKWYNQDENEWVLLLKGSAAIEFDDGNEIELRPGDYFLIPAHKKHRVTWTDKHEETIWLTIFYKS